MRLHVGQRAPLFAEYDIYRRPVNLAHYEGSSVLISFYRAAVCPLCNVRLWHLANRCSEYRARGLEIIAFVESSADLAHQYLDRQRLPFPVIADNTRTYYDLYGLERAFFRALFTRFTRRTIYPEAMRRHIGGNDWENLTRFDGVFSRLPADFLVGPDLSIKHAYYGADAGDFMLFEEIEAYLDQL